MEKSRCRFRQSGMLPIGFGRGEAVLPQRGTETELQRKKIEWEIPMEGTFRHEIIDKKRRIVFNSLIY